MPAGPAPMRATRSGLVTEPRLVGGAGGEVRRPVDALQDSRPPTTPTSRLGADFAALRAEGMKFSRICGGRGSGEAVDHESGEVLEGFLHRALGQRGELGDGVAGPLAGQLAGLLEDVVVPQLLDGRAQ